MQVRVHLGEIIHDRRTTLTEPAQMVDMTLANLSNIKTGEAKAIRFSTLAAICVALKCQPGDILTVEADDARQMEVARKQIT